jgi:hypothetical protein
MGMDYVVENRELEINFNIQLGDLQRIGRFQEKDLFFTKANQLLKEKSNEKNSISTCTFCFVLSCKSKQLL